MADSEQNNPTTGGSQQKPRALPQQQSDAPDEAAFVAQLKRGDQQAWTEFVDNYSPLLYNHLRPRLPTHDAADDVLNETLMALVRAIRQFDHQVSLTTFVFALAQRAVADYWRRLPQAELDHSTAISPALVDGLPDLLQQALLLRYHNGYSIDEIAHILGRSNKATESLLQRARNSLRIQMAAGAIPAVENAPDLMRPASLCSVLPMLSTQQQTCLDLQMPTEAAIFQRALRFLQRLMSEQPASETT